MQAKAQAQDDGSAAEQQSPREHLTPVGKVITYNQLAVDKPQENSRSLPEKYSEEVPTTAEDCAQEAEEATTSKDGDISRTDDHDKALEKQQPQDSNQNKAKLEETPEPPEPPYTIFSNRRKATVILIVSFVALISPISGSIYLPALNTLASDLGVSISNINLTITTYQIMQGIAPSFLASLSDVYGRRPVFLLTFLIYLVANVALALQDSYAALIVLRCLQSAGSSATIALSSATVADMVTRAERGSWMGWAAMAVSLGPAMGPVVGGLLNEYLGWRAIFWFLAIFASVLFGILFVILPETGRAVVGNGTVKPPWWNLSVLQWLRLRRGLPVNRGAEQEERTTISRPRRRPNPLSSLKILLEPEGGITLGYGSLLYAGYFMVMTTLSEQLTERFGFSSVQVGLCYLPLGIGSMCSRFTCGRLFDWNFRRHARLLGISLDLSHQQKIEVFPIEMIRLQISIPMIYISCGTVLGYAWAMESNASLVGIEIALFFQGLFFSGALQGMNTLIVDTHADTPATATAANNLFRCLMSAGGTAVAPLMIERIGVGWMGVFISGVWLLFSPCLWAVLIYGKRWRDGVKKKHEKRDAKRRREEGQGV